MRRIVIVLAATVAIAAAVAAVTDGTKGQEANASQRAAKIGLPATVVDLARPSALVTFTSARYNGKGVINKTEKSAWRVVQGTGNCCENYLTVNQQGRLFDFGGTYVNYSDDRGLTWKQVRPLTPLVNGEGTITLAPNGDVIAVGWDPYSGDHLQAFKYDAAGKSWSWAEMPLHQPFYDREWVTTIPGPFTIDGKSYPYISLLKGAYPWKDPAFYSLDGLDYMHVTSQFLDETLGTPTESWLPTKPDKSFDWIQPNSNGGMTPLGGGNALASGEFTSDYGLLTGSNLKWSAFTFPNGTQPDGVFQVDSVGRLHNLVVRGDGFDYRISPDGGKTWGTFPISLPAGYTVDQIDFRANKAVRMAAVAVHAQSSETLNDQDFVWTFDISKSTPKPKRRYTIGLGDVGATAGVGNDIRMDFQTVAIFPDGKIALSFLDSTTHFPSATTGQEQQRPAIAVEVKTPTK